MRVDSLEDVPFRLLLVATWAVAWGAMTVFDAIQALYGAGGSFGRYVFAFSGGVLGAVVLVLAVLLFTTAPFVRKATVCAFVALAVGEAVSATAADPVAMATVGLHLASALVLVLTRRFFRTDRADPEGSAVRVGAR
jgi:hypothetical protein